MKITVIRQPDAEETEVTITCRELTGDLNEIIAALSLIDNTVTGSAGEEIHFVPLRDVLYFETVDGKTFFYTADGTFETAARLYQLEEKLAGTSFARISKSVIANLKKLRCIRAEKYSRLCATLVNGEKLMVSRQYMDEIKHKLGVK